MHGRVATKRVRECSTKHEVLSHLSKFTYSGEKSSNKSDHFAIRVIRKSLSCRHYSTRMTEQNEWSAVRVRDTFLQYFKDNGHTFGKLHTA